MSSWIYTNTRDLCQCRRHCMSTFTSMARSLGSFFNERIRNHLWINFSSHFYDYQEARTLIFEDGVSWVKITSRGFAYPYKEWSQSVLWVRFAVNIFVFAPKFDKLWKGRVNIAVTYLTKGMAKMRFIRSLSTSEKKLVKRPILETCSIAYLTRPDKGEVH